jgi:predicted kinase
VEKQNPSINTDLEKVNGGIELIGKKICIWKEGKRGNEITRKEQQDRTIREALKAIESGATLITDNKNYIDSSDYNEGEKRLYKNLEARGYNYSEQTIDGQLLGVWNKQQIKSISTNKVQEIKPSVKELFESNPELVNAVYETLGFKSKPDVILPIGTSGSGKSTFIKSLPQENLVVIEPDTMRVEFTGDINDKSKDKEIYVEAAKRAVEAIKQGKQVVFDTTNLTKEKRLPFIEAIKKEIPNANIQYKLMELNPELAKQRIKADIAAGKNRANVSDATIDRHAESYKQMLGDIKNEPISNYELTPQQKQQAQQQYSAYLDTIFPDSKVKDIVYHGTNKEFDKFKKPSDVGSQNRMIAFADDIEYAKIAGARRTSLKKVISALVNVTKPYPVDKLEAMELDSGYRDEVLSELKKEGVDGFAFESDDDLATKNFNEILVFEPEQIHILSSKKDLEMFRNFINFTKSEYAKYGDIQQFKDYIMSKKINRIMQEQLISFETAKLAKEKGFNERTHWFYKVKSENDCCFC